jgi:hypothetical protein
MLCIQQRYSDGIGRVIICQTISRTNACFVYRCIWLTTILPFYCFVILLGLFPYDSLQHVLMKVGISRIAAGIAQKQATCGKAMEPLAGNSRVALGQLRSVAEILSEYGFS